MNYIIHTMAMLIDREIAEI